MSIRGLLPLAGFAGIIGCATSTPGAQPHDSSVAQHELNAADEEKVERGHAALYDAAASAPAMECGVTGRSDRDRCWTSTANPTAEHRRDAELHRKRAADHRAASLALRDAEGRACTGISESDRDESPFHHTEDITSIEPLSVYDGASNGSAGPAQFPRSARHVEGAVVEFRAVPGMTVEWLQRVVDCHLARNAALGHDVPEMSYCPLVPKGVEATVTAARGGFAVSIRSTVPAVAEDILRRSRALRGSHP
jgi:hypothetical protein